MLSFGLIIDKVIQPSKDMTFAEFDKKIKKVFFNYFFDKLEEGCTNFYTNFQNIYTCYAIDTINKISDITGVAIKINIYYEDEESYISILESPHYSEYISSPNITNLIFKDDLNKEEKYELPYTDVPSDSLQFNLLMDIVQECSSILFYNSDSVIDKNSRVTSIRNYCENYSMDYTNLFDKIF